MDESDSDRSSASSGPFVNAAWAGVVRGQGHRGFGRMPAILFAKLLKIPAADLDVSFRVAKKLDDIVRSLPFILLSPVSCAQSRATSGVTCIKPTSPSVPIFHGRNQVSS